ncbi:MAG: ORF6N domain-containing protein [Candidatus Omnitrophota bacterium]|nr:ORF6N domain-containing protein [Candidatus Omnitrophota bacterium]
MKGLIPQEIVENKIYLIRGYRVMLDKDLARLYGVETRVLNQAVKRNAKRFPEDFMFYLTRDEIRRMSQIVISLKFYKRVTVFTEQGVAMLSGVLNSDRAIQVNIAIMRAFVKLRRILSTHKELVHKLEELERKIEKHDVDIQSIFGAIRQLMAPPSSTARVITGFKTK